jgi:topoisomerase-4 subunit A
MIRFGLSDRQAEAILDLKLRNLAKLEEQKINGEQAELAKKRKNLQDILDSETKLKNLVHKELEEDANTFGDARRSKIVEREQAQALKESDRIPNDPISVILSLMGWVRTAKGHEVNAQELGYKAGDAFLMQLPAKMNDAIYFLDSTGRSYTLLAHTLPSARGHGEPLTTKLKPPAGATFVSMASGEEKQKLLLMSNEGFGFVTTLDELATKNRSGKTLLKVSAENKALPILSLSENKTRLALLTNKGRLLLVDLNEIPQMNKGKGNKIIQLAKNEGEVVQASLLLAQKEPLIVVAGKRKLELKPKELDQYWGDRGEKGQKLPKGFQQADMLFAV